MKSSFKKTVAFVAMIAWAILGLTLMQPVNAATVTPTVSNLKATAAGQKVTFSFDWDLTGKSVKEGDTLIITKENPEILIENESTNFNGSSLPFATLTLYFPYLEYQVGCSSISRRYQNVYLD